MNTNINQTKANADDLDIIGQLAELDMLSQENLAAINNARNGIGGSVTIEIDKSLIHYFK